MRTKMILGGGRGRLSVVYVDDLAELAMQAAVQPEVRGRCYNVSDGQLYSRLEILQQLQSQAGRPEKLFPVPAMLTPALLVLLRLGYRYLPNRYAPYFDPRNALFVINDHTISCARAIDELGYQPKVLLADGLAKTVEWIQREGFPASIKGAAEYAG